MSHRCPSGGSVAAHHVARTSGRAEVSAVIIATNVLAYTGLDVRATVAGIKIRTHQSTCRSGAAIDALSLGFHDSVAIVVPGYDAIAGTFHRLEASPRMDGGVTIAAVSVGCRVAGRCRRDFTETDGCAGPVAVPVGIDVEVVADARDALAGRAAFLTVVEEAMSYDAHLLSGRANGPTRPAVRVVGRRVVAHPAARSAGALRAGLAGDAVGELVRAGAGARVAVRAGAAAGGRGRRAVAEPVAERGRDGGAAAAAGLRADGGSARIGALGGRATVADASAGRYGPSTGLAGAARSTLHGHAHARAPCLVAALALTSAGAAATDVVDAVAAAAGVVVLALGPGGLERQADAGRVAVLAGRAGTRAAASA